MKKLQKVKIEGTGPKNVDKLTKIGVFFRIREKDAKIFFEIYKGIFSP